MTSALVAAGTLAVAAQSAALVAAEPAQPYVVVYDTPPREPFPVQRETAARERAHGFSSDHRFRHAIDGFAARLTRDQARALRADPEVALVEPDRTLHAARVPLAAHETVPTGVARIGAAQAAAGVHPPSSSAVAVLDTGIDLSHPDLVVRQGPNCTGNGLGPPQDDDGHGTFVAGVVGARNDGAGLVGVAPGTELYAVKVLAGEGAGLVSWIICGIDWVTANAAALGIRVANMSLSGPVEAEALRLAIQRSVAAGIVYVAAAGNGGSDLAGEIPGSYAEVLAVTAISDSDGAPGGAGPEPCSPGESDDSFATFSNYATRSADSARVVAAPGVCITSSARGGGEVTGTGTSAAAPHVAAVVALCMGEPGRAGPCAEMSPAEVIEQVRADAAANATSGNGFVGDPFWPVGPYFGHLVSAADPTVRRIPRRPAATAAATTSSAPPALDTALELLAMRIQRRQDVDRLRVVARLAEAGTVTATARVRVPGAAARARIIRASGASARMVPHRTQRLRLRLAPAGVRRIKRALRRGVRVRARVTMTVSDLAGNARTKSRRVRLRR